MAPVTSITTLLKLSALTCALPLALTFMVGCDSEDPVVDTPDMLVLGGGTDGGVEAGVEVGGTTPDSGALYLTYTRLVTEGSDTRADLVAFHMERQDELVLNPGMSRDDIDCAGYGCVLHPQLSWVGWIQRVDGQGHLWVAPIDKAAQQVDIANKRKLSEAALTFSFTDNHLVYSEVKDPTANNGISVKRAALEGGAGEEIDLVNANGGFTNSRSDDLVVLIKTTLSSMTLILHNLANGQILELFTFGAEGGTGSEYSANGNPVNISPRLDYVSAVTNSGFMWRLNLIEMTGGEPRTLDLFPVANVEEACTATLPYNQVLGAPQFNANGEHLYMLLGGNCSQLENPSANRRDYDVYRYSSDLSGEPLNITRILAFNHWANHDIGSFAVHPDETHLAFTATRPNKSGVKAIWLQEISEGSEANQDPVSFDCSRDPNVSPQLDPTGQRRCEFIVTEVATGGSVDYRALRFVRAEGL